MWNELRSPPAPRSSAPLLPLRTPSHLHSAAHQDALSPAALETIRQGCDTTIRRVVEHDPQRRGNRDSHRYSFANSAVHFGCAAEWSVLIDCEPVRSRRYE